MINLAPAALAAEVAKLIRNTAPSTRDVSEVRSQLLARQKQLLRDGATSEYVAETFFRCLVIDHLQRRYRLALEEIPYCINSSHTATRRVCATPTHHSHNRIADRNWAEGWRWLKREHPEVNVHVPGRPSPGRADLYLLTRGQVVSVEFKYVGSHRVRDVQACAAQVRRHADQHAATLLVLYNGAINGGEVRGTEQLCRCLGPAVPVVIVSGPNIPAR